MRKSKTIQFCGKDLIVSELTMPQISSMLQEINGERKPHLAELLMDSVIPIEAVVLSTGLSDQDLDSDVSPTEIEEVWTTVEEVNGFLSRLLAKLIAGETSGNQTSIQKNSNGSDVN